MSVVQILPGSGGRFYCENCLRDTALVQALRRRGEDVVLVPMYLPLYTDGAAVARGAPVFFGGINVYLQQHVELFRKTPRWLDRALDAPWALGLAARQEGATDASGMGAMTLSMLRGEDGHQAKEVERLIAWLVAQEQPDLVHLSSTMLLGLARRIKEAVNVPVVCSMQDEETWLDAVEPAYVEACWDAIRERAHDCDRFVTVSWAYREAMCTRLGLASDRVDVVPIGIDLAGYELATHTGPPAIGYLSKLSEQLGFGTLVEAFILLKTRPGLDALKLHAMGGLVGGDRRFVKRLRRRLERLGMWGDVTLSSALDRDARIAFVRDLSVMTVPMVCGEAFGTFILEAWAAGVPVVQPRAGGFPELIESTGGGVLYDGATPEALADALEPILRDRELARELGSRGREGVARDYSVETMAARMVRVYEGVRESWHGQE